MPVPGDHLSIMTGKLKLLQRRFSPRKKSSLPSPIQGPRTSTSLSLLGDSSTSAKSTLTNDAIKYIKATLGIFPSLTGITDTSSEEHPDNNAKAFKEYFRQLIELIGKLLVEQDDRSKVPQTLKYSLNRHSSEIRAIYDRACSDTHDIDKTSREISQLLESFLFVHHMEGSIPPPDSSKNVGNHVLSEAVRNLPRAVAAYNDYASKDKNRVTCFQGTRQALLREMAEWIGKLAQDGTRAYVISAPAGTGKSTIAQTVAERADHFGYLGASFFFSRNEVERRSAKKFITTIAYQLCVYDAHFATAIGNTLSKLEKRGPAPNSDTQAQLFALIITPLRDIVKSRSQPIVIVVDALDECNDEDRPGILAALRILISELASFKVILTTRPHPDVQIYLEGLEVSYPQSMEEGAVDGDIRLYLKHMLSQNQVMARLPELDEPWCASDDDIESLAAAVGRLFVMASTAVLFILAEAAYNPEAQMKVVQAALARNQMPFNALNDFYTIILRNAIPPDCERGVVGRYQEVVGTIVVLRQPLPVQSLSHLINMPRNDILAVLDNLQSVISLGNDNMPRIYHKSFLDYVTDPERCKDKDLHIVSRQHHTRIATLSLQRMNDHLKRNVLGLDGHAQYLFNDSALKQRQTSREEYHVQDTQARMQNHIPAELEYACKNWANHLENAETQDMELVNALKIFANNHMLHWFEALSWINKLELAHHALDVVRNLLGDADPAVCQIFSDGLRLALKFYELIRRSALHTYHSALPFAPTKSLVHAIYQTEMMSNSYQLEWEPIERGPTEWDPLIATLSHANTPDDFDGCRISRIMFSSDNIRFASWSGKDMMLWDGTSGKLIRTFEGPGIALSENFSAVATWQDSSVTLHNLLGDEKNCFSIPKEILRLALSFDGSQLAAQLSDGTVSLWEVWNEREARSLGPCAHDSRLKFSPSGNQVAFVSAANDIIMAQNGDKWSLTSSYHPSQNHVHLIFSSDGSRLASLAEEDGVFNLTLWTCADGQLVGEAHDVGIALAVSPDGSLLATGDRNVKVWDGKAGKLLVNHSFDFGPWIRSMTFSPDILAIAPFISDTLTLYDLKRCAFIATLTFPSALSLAFSPNGARLAAGNHEGTVYMWDVLSIGTSMTPTSNQQSRPVTALAFSKDCSRLAAGFLDGTISLRKTSSNRQCETSHNDGHTQKITALAFSPSGEQLASGSEDKTVRLWDSSNGTLIGIIKPSFPLEITSLAFSNSSLAVATDEDITLWDPKTFRLKDAFKKGGRSLSFSQDGCFLASAYDSLSTPDVTVWDVKSLSPIATCKVDLEVELLLFSDHSPQLAIQLGDGNFRVFSYKTQEINKNPRRRDLIWIPHLNGISWKHEHELGYSLVGYTPKSDIRVPLLWIPRDIDVDVFTIGSCMFAFGCQDGRIVLGRPTPAK